MTSNFLHGPLTCPRLLQTPSRVWIVVSSELLDSGWFVSSAVEQFPKLENLDRGLLLSMEAITHVEFVKQREHYSGEESRKKSEGKPKIPALQHRKLIGRYAQLMGESQCIVYDPTWITYVPTTSEERNQVSAAFLPWALKEIEKDATVYLCLAPPSVSGTRKAEKAKYAQMRANLTVCFIRGEPDLLDIKNKILKSAVPPRPGVPLTSLRDCLVSIDTCAATCKIKINKVIRRETTLAMIDTAMGGGARLMIVPQALRELTVDPDPAGQPSGNQLEGQETWAQVQERLPLRPASLPLLPAHVCKISGEPADLDRGDFVVLREMLQHQGDHSLLLVFTFDKAVAGLADLLGTGPIRCRGIFLDKEHSSGLNPLSGIAG